MTTSRRTIRLALGGLYLLLVIFSAKSLDGNHFSRLAHLSSIVKHSRYSIEPRYRAFSTGFVESPNGVYSDKAPGLVLMCVPAIVLISASDLTPSPEQEEIWPIDPQLAGICCIAPFAIFGFLICQAVLSRFTSQAVAWVWASACYLTVPCFLFAGVLMSHTVAVTFIWLSIYLIIKANETAQLGFTFSSGLAAGLSVVCEYSSLVPVIGTLFLYRLSARGVKRWFLGFLAMCVIILIHTFVVYGSIFVLPYTANPIFPKMEHGIGGITFVPNLSNVFTMLASHDKGLLIWNIALLFGWVGIGVAWRSEARVTLCTAIVVATQVTLLSSFPYSDGHWVGARLLTPIVPYIILVGVIASRNRRWERIGLMAVFISLCQCLPVIIAGGAIPRTKGFAMMDKWFETVTLVGTNSLASAQLGIWASYIAVLALLIKVTPLCTGETTAENNVNKP